MLLLPITKQNVYRTCVSTSQWACLCKQNYEEEDLRQDCNQRPSRKTERKREGHRKRERAAPRGERWPWGDECIVATCPSEVTLGIDT